MSAQPGPENGTGRVHAAHTVHAAPGWGGRRAEKELRDGRRVGVEPWRWPAEELAQVHAAAVDVSADAVRLQALESAGRDRTPRPDELPEAWREAFDLVLHLSREVAVGAVGHVAVGPGDVAAGGGAAGVEQGRLHQQHEGSQRVPALGHL